MEVQSSNRWKQRLHCYVTAKLTTVGMIKYSIGLVTMEKHNDPH